MSGIGTRHIGNDDHVQAEAVLKLVEAARSVLYLNQTDDRFWLGTSMDPPLDEREIVALERARTAIKHGPPEFREAMKEACRRRKLVVAS